MASRRDRAIPTVEFDQEMQSRPPFAKRFAHRKFPFAPVGRRCRLRFG